MLIAKIMTVDIIKYWSLFCVPLAILLFVLPSRMRIRAQAIWIIVLMACGIKGLVYEQFGGNAMAPDLPEKLIWLWNWADDGMFFLVALSILWLLLPFHRRLNGLRVVLLPLLAWGIAAWGQYNGTVLPGVREVELTFPDLPLALDGYRIAQVSDLHCSSAARGWRTRAVVDLVNGLDADLVCLTGDYVDGTVASLGDDLAPLKGLRAKDGVYCIRGNHEYYLDHSAWWKWFQGNGFRVLRNECVFPRPGLALGGVSDLHASRYGDVAPDVRQAFAAATNGEFRILMEHRPKNAAENFREVGVRLQLSGHTHGGVAPGLRKLVSRHNGGFSRGVYRFGDAVLHVSPGCGQWVGFPMRFFNPSEVTVLVLRSKWADAAAVEARMRARFDRKGVCDFVIPGGSRDAARIESQDGASRSELKVGRLVRHLGGEACPEGAISVRLNAPADARIHVDLDWAGCRDCAIVTNWADGVWTVRVAKKREKGVPDVISISAEAPDARAGQVSYDHGVRTPTTEPNCRIFIEDWRHLRWLENKKAIAESGGEFDLVMIGDSITHRWQRQDNGYPLEDEPAYAKLKRGRRVLNLGYSGDRTSDLLWRLEHGELDGYRAKVISLMIGANNTPDPKEETAKGIRKILDLILLKHPESTVLLNAILPIGSKGSAKPAKRSEVNALIRGFADGQRVRWVDFSEEMPDPDGYNRSRFEDGVHPNGAGYEIWLKALLQELGDRGI